MEDRLYVERNDAERERLRALLGRLGDDDLGRVLEGGWTVAAVLAHLTFWDRRALVLLERWERDGVGPSPYDADAINDAARPQWLAIPPHVAASEALAAAEAVDTRLAELGPEQLEAIHAAGNPINPMRAVHRGEHLDEIERALIEAAGSR